MKSRIVTAELWSVQSWKAEFWSGRTFLKGGENSNFHNFFLEVQNNQYIHVYLATHNILLYLSFYRYNLSASFVNITGTVQVENNDFPMELAIFDVLWDHS